MRRMRRALPFTLLSALALMALPALLAAQTAPPQQTAPATPKPQPGDVTPPAQPAPVPATPPSAAESEAQALRPLKAFDLTAVDKSADPCADFYQYACGGWMAKNPVPSDQGRWGRFNELAEHNRALLRQILDKAAAPSPKRSAVEQKIGDFYASCMDEAAANAAGAKPIAGELQRIDAIATVPQLMDEIARLQGMTVNVLFRFGQQPDFHDARATIAALDQGGLGLPNKDYYTKTDAKSVETRERYQQHVEKMLALLGTAPAQAADDAKTVMDIENRLAAPSWDPVQRRDPKNLDHPMTRAEAQKLAPTFGLDRFFVATGAPAITKLNVGNPEFFKQVDAMLSSVPIAAWKSYLRWHLAHEVAPYLSQPFVDENFAFYQQYLGGQKELQARWKRCVTLTDDLLGEALGQPYVEQNFPPDAKARTLAMVGEIEKSMGSDLQDLPWMTPATKQAAAGKLAAVANKIGYPDKWRDYGSVNVVRGDLAGNVLRAQQFEYRRNLDKIGKPVDRSEWGMSPPTVNAYYSPLQNNINFPAGILEPPFYDNKADDAVNFGGVGAVIGHELTHGFDDQGAKFDADGNLRDWWTPQDNAEFKTRTECIADEYGGFTAVGDLKLNGHLTLGENTADNGGVRLALMALHRSMESKPLGVVEGYTPEQRFFISFAQIWCSNQTPETARLRALTDPHSPGRYRTNGVLQNMPEFAAAWKCSADAPMVSKTACHVW
ncbi:MAG TPA: M13 family metallopeptidase [Thermoanaerobaculia bacterium]|nr:M13 family metallopeptidase [Thermoanaerobaculia bacterium]